MAIGTVKFFNDAKGFGFIVPHDGGKDVFVHKTAVELAGMPPLRKGQALTFETETDAKGITRASELKLYVSASMSPTANDNALGAVGKEERAQTRGTNSNANAKLTRVPPSSISRTSRPEAERASNHHKSNAAWQRSYDHYCALAQGCSEDDTTREHYWQHAEHFLRMMNGSTDPS